MRVYIAGPMRGRPAFNFAAFDAARDWLHGLGWGVVSPADEDRVRWDKPSDYLPTEDDVEAFTRLDWFSAMRHDLDLIVNEVDAVAVLPGWAQSDGARAEQFVARTIGLPVFDVPAEVLPEECR